MSSRKFSKYNLIINDTPNSIIYNSKTNALALLDSDSYKKIADSIVSDVELYDEDLVKSLYENGFLIDEDVDELQELKYREANSRFDKSILSILIIPTSNCNFRCTYCYESEVIRPSTMSEETQKALISFITEQLGPVRLLDVTWYGGEPLLRFDIVKKLSYQLKRLCESRGIEYKASMITNGYLLKSEVVGELNDLDIEYIQITIDGEEEVHNKRRPLRNGEGTFKNIIDNLCEVKDFINADIAIRINVDRNNIHGIDTIIEALKGKGLYENVNCYVARVECEGNCLAENCFSPKEFSPIESTFARNNSKEAYLKMPEQIGNVCSADHVNSFIVDSDGALYKCWNEIGRKERSIGNIDEGFINPSLAYEYLLYSAIDDSRCKECKCLPLCMGGCPEKRIKGISSRCPHIKYDLKARITYIAENLINSNI